jgi:hypothetical protein
MQQQQPNSKKTYIHLVIFNHGKNRLEVSGSFEMFVELMRGIGLAWEKSGEDDASDRSDPEESAPPTS